MEIPAQLIRLRSTLFPVFWLLPGLAYGLDCSGLPTSFTGNEFPTGDFFTNFDNACYTIHMGAGHGTGKFGDLNATYFQAYYKVDPRYQLILVGTFPNARYFSVTLYDAHSATGQSILDEKIVPLTSSYVNPFLPGQTFVDGQKFAIPIGFGGVPGGLQTGCMMNAYNVGVNGLDATRRHAGMDWNTDAGLFQAHPNFAVHVVDTPQHTNPNTAGVLLVRAYMDITTQNYQTNPHLIVRDVASGCAYPAAYVQSTLQVVANGTSGGAWLDHAQQQAHSFYETSFLPRVCYANPAAPARLAWERQPEYVPGASPDNSYLVSTVPAGTPAALAAAGEVVRIRLRVPTTPPTPCTNGCFRTGQEQMRYMSLSFLIPGGSPIASLDDAAFVKDPNGYATLIVGTGAAIPSWITAANHYTFLDLTKISGYDQLSLLDLRHIIPMGAFNCAGQFVPYRTGSAVPAGSLMGDYAPVVDYPVASTLPQTATSLIQTSACAQFPSGSAGVRPDCAVLAPTPVTITSVVTQCQAAGCGRFVAQPSPPIIMNGDGFGAFPDGLPFSGVSGYIQISDVTAKWSAGHTGNQCTVAISSWDNDRIQLVANVGGTKCPIKAGDKLEVKVWNPQTMLSAEFSVTVSAN